MCAALTFQVSRYSEIFPMSFLGKWLGANLHFILIILTLSTSLFICIKVLWVLLDAQ